MPPPKQNQLQPPWRESTCFRKNRPQLLPKQINDGAACAASAALHAQMALGHFRRVTRSSAEEDHEMEMLLGRLAATLAPEGLALLFLFSAWHVLRVVVGPHVL